MADQSLPLPAAGDTPPDGPPNAGWATPMPDGVSPELAQQILAIAPGPPESVDLNDPEAVARWEMCSRIAALAAIFHGDQASERDRRSFAWQAARVLYDSETPLNEISAAA